MAAVEAPRRNAQKKLDFLHELSNFVERASDCLLLKDFDGCEATCKHGIIRAKSFLEEEKACQCMESLCILCIQAMAELNRWQDVLPFIQDVFSSIELCPPMVIQICLLLHAKVKEYTQCHALASLWLRCEDNSYKPGYDRVACLYIAHVMIPKGQLLLVAQFLNSCTYLPEQVKKNIFLKSEEIVESLQNESKMNKKDYSNSETSVLPVEENCSVNDDKETDGSLSMTNYMKSICCMLASKLTYPTLDTLWKLAAAVVGLFILAKLSIDGDLLNDLGRATIIWQSVLKMLKAIFSPYRPGR